MDQSDVQRSFILVDATSALTSLINPQPDEHIICETLEAFDGLERMFVIAVDMDSAVDRASFDDRNDSRCRLYRALTRAQMQAVVVNEHLPGGLLEFLGHVKLDDMEFNQDLAIESQEHKAVNAICGKVDVKQPDTSPNPSPSPGSKKPNEDASHDSQPIPVERAEPTVAAAPSASADMKALYCIN